MATPCYRIDSTTWERVLQDLRQCCQSGEFGTKDLTAKPGEPQGSALLSTPQLVTLLQALCAQGLLRQPRPLLPLPSPLDLRTPLEDALQWELLSGDLGWIPLQLVLRKMMLPGLLEHALYRATQSPKAYGYLCAGHMEMELALNAVDELLRQELGARPLRSLLAPQPARA